MLEIEINLNDDRLTIYNSRRKVVASYEKLKEPIKIREILSKIFDNVECQESMDIMLTEINEDIIKTIGEW